jgi:hypothetical protein
LINGIPSKFQLDHASRQLPAALDQWNTIIISPQSSQQPVASRS